MGMYVDVKGVRDLSMNFEKMMNVKKACDDADVGYPVVIEEYFGSNVDESEDMIRSEMELADIAYIETHPDSADVYEIELSKIPEDIKKIRFIISY